MNPEVYEAAKSGNLSEIQGLEENGLCQVTHKRSTILHIAVRFNQEVIVEHVLSKFPMLVLQANADGDTPLHIAARIGSLEMAKLLIGAAKEMRDPEGQPVEMEDMLSKKNLVREDTALHVAVRNGHLDVVEFLIAENWELLNVVNGAEESPLFLAVEKDFFGIAKHILENFPHPLALSHCGGSNGMNALHAAVIRTHRAGFLVSNSLMKKLRLLINTKSDARESIPRSQQTERDIMELLLERNPTLVEGKDIYDWTPLHCAAQLGHLKAAKLLLKHCSSAAYLQNKKGFCALHVAATEGHSDVMEEIIHQKPDACELVDNRGWTALHVAVANKRKKVVKYILEEPKLEFLLNVADKEGNTPLHLAACLKDQEILELLVQDHRVDKRASNLKFLRPTDIFQKNPYIDDWEKSIINWKTQSRGSLEFILRGTDEYENPIGNNEEGDEEEEQTPGSVTAKLPIVKEVKSVHEKKATKYARVKEISNTHLLVAALIATVAFTAAFTVPGGYQDDGVAILSKKEFFKVFVVADSIAFFFSTAAVLLHFIGSNQLRYDRVLSFSEYAAKLTYFSVIAIVVAFTFGFRVVIPSPSKLGNYILATGGISIFYIFVGIDRKINIKQYFGGR